jgi:hypothetical protein
VHRLFGWEVVECYGFFTIFPQALAGLGILHLELCDEFLAIALGDLPHVRLLECGQILVAFRDRFVGGCTSNSSAKSDPPPCRPGAAARPQPSAPPKNGLRIRFAFMEIASAWVNANPNKR